MIKARSDYPYFVTFGFGQYNGELRDSYVLVWSRGEAFEMFGNRWSSIYPISDLPRQREQFDLKPVTAGHVLRLRAHYYPEDKQ